MKKLQGQTLVRLAYLCVALGILYFVLASLSIGGETGKTYFLVGGLTLSILGATIWTNLKLSKCSQWTGTAVSLGLIALSYAALSLDLIAEEIAISISTPSVLVF